MKRCLNQFGLLFLFLAIMLTLCSCEKPIVLTEADDGTEITIDIGERFSVRLDSNHSTGYRWQNITKSESVVQVGTPQYKEEPACDAPGCGGVATFTFEGAVAGKTVLQLVYSRPWENDPPLKRFEVTVLVSKGVSDEEPEKIKGRDMNPDVTGDQIEMLVKGNTDFAVSLYHQLAQVENGNIFYSPYSISTVLAMVYAGAETETEAQIAKALSFELPEEVLHAGFNYLDLELDKRGAAFSGADGGAFRLNIANAIWAMREGLVLVPDFTDILALNYGAELHMLDFSLPGESSETINQWIAQQTENRITGMLTENTTENASLILTNAIYFNAAWEHPFEEWLTREIGFVLLDGTLKPVPTMIVEPDSDPGFRYFETDEYQVVSLPYKGDELEMILILPAAGQFKAVESSFDSKLLKDILSNLQSAHVQLAMPKWESRLKLNLCETLSKMGMPIAFDGSADFSGMSVINDQLYISDVVHEAYIKVNERGTEAVAVSTVSMGESAIERVFANRPFLYLIMDKETQTVLFLGRILDPSAI